MVEPSDRRPEPESSYDEVLDVANVYARAWLSGVRERPIPPRLGPEQIKDRLGRALPESGEPAIEVIERLAVGAEPGLMAIGSPRFFGWVIGGTQPVALAADWLVSAWDQNTGLSTIAPATVAAEELAEEWLVDVLGLPTGSEVGFVTGATMAQFSCMAAARRITASRGLGRRNGRHGGRAGDPFHRRRGAPWHGGPRRSLPRPGNADRGPE